MYRLSKKIEYAILALQFLSLEMDRKVPAKEIAEKLNISFEFLAKTLQQLIKTGFVVSHQGAHGGYVLARKPEMISVSDVILALNGKKGIVECVGDHEDVENCVRADYCSIRHPMVMLQEKIDSILESTTIAELSGREIIDLDLNFEYQN